MDGKLFSCQSPTRKDCRKKRWNKLLKVLENEKYVLMEKSTKIEACLRNCRLKMRLLRLTSHIEMYGTNALSSNRSTRNNSKRKFQEIESLNLDGWCSNSAAKESTEGSGLWTPEVCDETENSTKVPCYVPPVVSNEVDALYAFNFRGDDSRKKTLQLKITARIVPLSMRSIKRNVDVEAANKALKGYTHNWSLKFTPINEDTFRFIDKIVVYLHPTCDEQFVTLKFSKKKHSASISQYGWGSFKVRLLYHFIYPEFNRPVEQIFDLDFIINQISGFERIAHISVCDLERDDIHRLRTLHTDEKQSSSSSESEDDFNPSMKKYRLFEDERFEEDDISFDSILSYNTTDSDPYSGVLFSSESCPLSQIPLADVQPESSQHNEATTYIKIENSSQSIVTQSDSIMSDPDSPNVLESSFDSYDKTNLLLQNSILHPCQNVSISSSKSESSSQSTLTQSDSIISDSYSPNILESPSESCGKPILSLQRSISHLSQSVSINSSTSDSSESSTKLNINTDIPQQFNYEKMQTFPTYCNHSDSSYCSSQKSTESSECRLCRLERYELASSPSLSKNVSKSERKDSLIKVSEIRDLKLESAHLPTHSQTPSTNLHSNTKPIILSTHSQSPFANLHSNIKPIILPTHSQSPSANLHSSTKPIIQAQAVVSAGKILIRHDGKSKLIRIIKAGGTSLLKKTPNPIPTPKPKEDENKVHQNDVNLKGDLSRKIENVRLAVSGMNFEDALIFCLKNYPIVTKEASNKIYKQLHPYASKSNEEFLSWRFGKRAASMSKHARFIHGILFGNCRGEHWSWVEVRQYIKYHGYVPFAKINGVCKPRSSNLEVTRTSLTCLNQLPDIVQLRKLRSQLEEITCKVDVDDTIQLHSSSQNSQSSQYHTENNDRTIKDFTAPEDFELCQWIIRTNKMFNVYVNDEFVPEILMSVFKSFAELILRRSLAAMMNRKRRNNNIRVKDVLNSVLFTDKLRILTEQGLGKKPLKCTIQSY